MKQYHYKKVIGFTEQQRQAFVILEDHGVNINKFIRQAIAEKIKKDLDPFLMDESGDVRNRIRWIQNIIKPFVDFYRGSSIRMDMNAEIISMSRESKGRREDALDRILYWQRMAEAMKEAKSPQVAEMIKGQFGLRDTEHKTKIGRASCRERVFRAV